MGVSMTAPLGSGNATKRSERVSSSVGARHGALLKDAARVISEKAFAPDEYQWRENEKRELTRCLVPHATKSRNGHRPDDKGKSVQGVR